MSQQLQHKIGTCEVCDTNDIIIKCHHGNMWFCDTCWSIEEKAQAENMTETKQQERVNDASLKVNDAIRQARMIDSSINVRTDLFNAATTSILELKSSIDSDDSITNKPFALASELMTRFGHFKNVVFELNQKIVDAGNQQKAIQVYLNQLANSLREDERTKLKIADINYKPSAPKSITIKAVKTTAKKLDKVELRKYAAELGISEFTLQMIVVQKGITVEAAARMIRHSLNAAKSE